MKKKKFYKLEACTGMVCEACLSSNAYCPWTHDYTLSGSMSDCLNIPNFAFVYIGM